MKAKKTLLKILTVLLLAACVFALYSCNDEPEAEYTVSYMVDGEVYYTQTVKSEAELKLPANPSKEGYTFDGWYLDENTWENIFSTSYALTENISVYAKFTENQSGDNGGNGGSGDNTDTHTHSLSHIDAKSATCTESGNVEYWSCSSCGKSFLDANASTEATSVSVPAAHSLTHHEAVAASCTAEGVIEYWSCSACSKNFSDSAATTEAATLAVAKAAHSLTHSAAVTPTCTVNGTVEYWACSVCEKKFGAENAETEITDISVPAVHALTHYTAVESTCTEEGVIEYWSCSVCTKNFTDANGTSEAVSLVMTKKAHTLSHHTAVESTCTEEGVIEYWSCSVCTKNFSDSAATTEAIALAVEKIAHTTTHHPAVASTCTEEGVKECYSCSVCRKFFADSACTHELTELAVAKLAHKLGNDCYCKVCGTAGFELEYELNSDGISYSVVGLGNFKGTHLTIPDYYNELPVTVIESVGTGGFNETLIVSVVIGNNVKEIKSGAFYVYLSLRRVVLPESLVTLDSYSFMNCHVVEICNKSSINIVAQSRDYTFLTQNAINVYTPNEGASKIDESSYPGFMFYTDETGAYLLACMLEGEICVLPDSYNGELYDIYEDASAGMVSELVISDGVRNIGEDAFSMGNLNVYLNKLTLGSNVISIGDGSFGNPNLYELYNRSSLNITKGSSEFGYLGLCPLKHIYTDPQTVSKIDTETYHGLSFYADESECCLLNYTGDDAILSLPESYKGRSYKINSYSFLMATDIINITLSAGVTSIGDNAFFGCTSLENINFGESSQLQSIGDSAFCYCQSLESISIPSSVESIGDEAFFDCTSLETVSFGENSLLESMGSSAFGNCTSFISVTIPESVTSIGLHAFSNCTSLETVSFGENSLLESIGSYAFYECQKLVSITIPESVTSIGSDAFWCCYKLVEVYNKSSLNIETGSSSNGYVGYYALNVYTEEDGSRLETTSDGFLFCSDGTVNYLLGYVGNETNLVLPESYKGGNYSVNQYAFYDNINIVSITIPESVTGIGAYAFHNCINLTSIVFEDTSTWVRIPFSITDVTVPSTNAEYFKSAYSSSSWLKM